MLHMSCQLLPYRQGKLDVYMIPVASTGLQFPAGTPVQVPLLTGLDPVMIL